MAVLCQFGSYFSLTEKHQLDMIKAAKISEIDPYSGTDPVCESYSLKEE